MAALTAGVDHPHKGNLDQHLISVPAESGGDTFYKGAFVFSDATTGLAQVSTPATGDVFIGICAETTVAAAGDLVPIYTGGLWALNIETPEAGDVGDVCVVDISDAGRSDNPADAMPSGDAAGGLADTDILIGKILAIDTEESTRAWIMIRPGWEYLLTGNFGWV